MSFWDEVQGQEAVTQQLRYAAIQETPAHAWLLTGPPGSGRSVAARAFAASLNCQQASPGDRGCGTCASCRLVLSGTHPDITVVETEKTTMSIAEARELVVRAQDRPSMGRWRVIIIEDADRMTERAGNVLLKALEEPPPQTIWVLCAPSPADVLVTIRSRCRLVVLRIPPASAVAELLTRRDGIDPEVALISAQAAQSHIGVARRLALDPESRQRRDDVVRLPLNLSDVRQAVLAAQALLDTATAEAQANTEKRNETEREQLMDSLGNPEAKRLPPALRSQLKHLEQEQKRRARRSVTDALDRALTDLMSSYRDILLLQFSRNQIPDQNLVNPHLRAELLPFSRSREPEDTLRQLETVMEARRRLLTSNVAPLLTLEAMLVDLSSEQKVA